MEQSLCLSSKEEYPSSSPFPNKKTCCFVFERIKLAFLSSRGTLSFSFEQKISFWSFHKNIKSLSSAKEKVFCLLQNGKKLFYKKKRFLLYLRKKKSFLLCLQRKSCFLSRRKAFSSKEDLFKTKSFCSSLSLSLSKKEK